MKTMLVLALTTVFFSCTSALSWKECFSFGCFKETSEECLNNDLPRNACLLSPFVFTNDKVNLTSANCGSRFKREYFEQIPTRVHWSKAKKDSYYTLLFIEHFLVETQELFWGVSNINGTFLKKGGDISQGYTTLHEYVGPYNLLRSSLVLIYEQTRRIPDDLKLRHIPSSLQESSDRLNVSIPAKGRINLDTWNFAWNQHLRGPLAGLQLIITD